MLVFALAYSDSTLFDYIRSHIISTFGIKRNNQHLVKRVDEAIKAIYSNREIKNKQKNKIILMFFIFTEELKSEGNEELLRCGAKDRR